MSGTTCDVDILFFKLHRWPPVLVNDVVSELDSITHPYQNPQDRDSNDVEGDSQPHSKMTTPDMSPSKTEHTNAVVESWLKESQHEFGIAPLFSATSPVSASEETKEVPVSVRRDQAYSQKRFHHQAREQSTAIQEAEETTRGDDEHRVAEGTNTQMLATADSSTLSESHRKFEMHPLSFSIR